MLDKFLIRKKAIDLHNEQADLFADWYEHFESNAYFNAFTYGRKQLMAFLSTYIQRHLSKGTEVLDIGAGTGHTMGMLKKWGYQSIGVEPAFVMRQKAQKLDPSIQLVDATVDTLPFSDARFDAVLAIEVFRYLDERDCLAGYTEALRVLKPGGYFIFTLMNTYCLSGFALYYPFKRLIRFLRNQEIHYDHFTTPHAIKKLLRGRFDEQIESVETYGTTFAPMFVMYKTYRSLTSRLARFIEPFDRRVNLYSWHAPLAGNLTVIVKKKV